LHLPCAVNVSLEFAGMDIRHLLRSASLSPSFSVITTSSMKVLLNTCIIRLTTSGSAAVLPCARAVRPSSCVDSDQHRVVGNSRALAPKQGGCRRSQDGYEHRLRAGARDQQMALSNSVMGLHATPGSTSSRQCVYDYDLCVHLRSVRLLSQGKSVSYIFRPKA
jgi:hypothetical protein